MQIDMNYTYSVSLGTKIMSRKLSVAHQYIALLTLPDRSMPPMEADTVYEGCLPSCELHSRLFTVRAYR